MEIGAGSEEASEPVQGNAQEVLTVVAPPVQDNPSEAEAVVEAAHPQDGVREQGELEDSSAFYSPRGSNDSPASSPSGSETSQDSQGAPSPPAQDGLETSAAAESLPPTAETARPTTAAASSGAEEDADFAEEASDTVNEQPEVAVADEEPPKPELPRRTAAWIPPLLSKLDESLPASEYVAVQRGLLWDVLRDGTCPLHLRVRLEQAFRQPAVDPPVVVPSPATVDASVEGDIQPSIVELSVDKQVHINDLSGRCSAAVVSMLSLPDALAIRSCGSFGLNWAMERVVAEGTELEKAHNRIRARLWIQRVSDLTAGTADETIFETQVRSFANDALRRRMESEMVEAKLHMERQILAFQGEVDRRMEEQAMRVQTIVEERVQDQLDTILASEMERVRQLVEERVQERVRLLVQREVRQVVCEVHVRLAVLVRENEQLRGAFAKHADTCFKSLVWALNLDNDVSWGIKRKGLIARALQVLWCCRRRARGAKSWLSGKDVEPQGSGPQPLRARLEALQRLAASSSAEDASAISDLAKFWGPVIDLMEATRPRAIAAATAGLVAPNEPSASEAGGASSASASASASAPSDAASTTVVSAAHADGGASIAGSSHVATLAPLPGEASANAADVTTDNANASSVVAADVDVASVRIAAAPVSRSDAAATPDPSQARTVHGQLDSRDEEPDEEVWESRLGLEEPPEPYEESSDDVDSPS
eukprot:TRINITY_DN25890_c0_g1_i1.p1 TRINITY_DN25890_c0_g1~~TRINITY_DN25890_c0_g1_i1.p1  ORF type:complete len:711 (+),score=124.90 TRINITY_DN25890_c0_g1_i1:34-2166(+)